MESPHEREEGSEERWPLGRPGWVSPEAMAVVTVAWGIGTLTAMPFVDGSKRGMPALLPVVLSALVAAAVARWSLRGRTVFRTLAGGAIGGALVVIAFGFIELFTTPVAMSLGPAGGLIVALVPVAGAIGGLVMGFLALVVTLAGANAARRKSLDVLDEVMLAGGGWLALIGGLTLALNERAAVYSAPAALFGAGQLVVVAVRDWMRVKWVTRLFRGELPGLRVVAGERDATPMLGDYRDRTATRHIEVVPGRDAEKWAYRSAEAERPGEVRSLALVPSDLAGARRPFLVRMAIAIGALGVVGGAAVWVRVGMANGP